MISFTFGCYYYYQGLCCLRILMSRWPVKHRCQPFLPQVPGRLEAHSGLIATLADRVQCQLGPGWNHAAHWHCSQLWWWVVNISWLLGFQTHAYNIQTHLQTHTWICIFLKQEINSKISEYDTDLYFINCWSFSSQTLMIHHYDQECYVSWLDCFVQSQQSRSEMWKFHLLFLQMLSSELWVHNISKVSCQIIFGYI